MHLSEVSDIEQVIRVKQLRLLKSEYITARM